MKSDHILILSALEGGVELPGLAFADLIGGWRRGSAYAGLATLQKEGHIMARWVTLERPTRLFSITPLGRTALSGWREQVKNAYPEYQNL